MEEINIQDYTIEWGAEADPIIVLTGDFKEFEEFCSKTHRSKKQAIAVTQGFQIPFYPHLPIVHYGTYWLNGAYNSPEYNFRKEELMLKEIK